MIVVNSKRTNVRKIAGSFIIPGANVFSDEIAKDIIASKCFKEDENISVEGEAKKVVKPSKVVDVVKAISEIESITQLKELSESDKRRDVARAVKVRITEIETERAKREAEKVAK